MTCHELFQYIIEGEKMDVISREQYIRRLDSMRNNGSVKVLTGLRRCGKTTVLFTLFKQHLLNLGITEDHIIEIALDSLDYENLREKHALYDYIKKSISGISHSGKEEIYIFIDEIQYVDGFWEVVNSLMRFQNVDIYVTGSNSKMLSKDILTEFRGRSTEIKIMPLMFSEFLPVYIRNYSEQYNNNYLPRSAVSDAWKEYYTYGGMPEVLTYEENEKVNYLQNLFEKLYIKDIVERNKIKNPEVLRQLLEVLSSSTGSLTNPSNISKTFKSSLGRVEDDEKETASYNTVSSYIGYCLDAFLIERAEQFNIKGRKYIEAKSKYYFSDVGLRNAILNLRQQEENHIMENIIYNELIYRGYKVDVGVVTVRENIDGKRKDIPLEVDFVANKGSQRYYVQSAFAIPDESKMRQESKSLLKLNDAFKKIIVIKDDIKVKRDESGIVTIGLYEFLLNESSLDL